MPAGEARVACGDRKPQVSYWGHWLLPKAESTCSTPMPNHVPRSSSYSFATRRITPVLSLEKKPARGRPSLGASRAGAPSSTTQSDPQSAIKMVETPLGKS